MAYTPLAIINTLRASNSTHYGKRKQRTQKRNKETKKGSSKIAQQKDPPCWVFLFTEKAGGCPQSLQWCSWRHFA